MKSFKQLAGALVATVTLALGLSHSAYAQQEAPDAFVKRISQEVLDIAKSDKEIQKGNQQHVLEVVQAKILPNVDFQRMTSLAAGRYWRQATPDQQKRLIEEFRDLLVYTYSGAITQVRDQRIEFKSTRGGADDSEVEVRSEVVQSRSEPIQINYRLEKTPTGWKIFDINVFGAWLVETYKGNFASEISKGGIDGLIQTLAERNKKLANGGARPPKAAS
jgi:phospholipid transport system substrate-binding protein